MRVSTGTADRLERLLAQHLNSTEQSRQSPSAPAAPAASAASAAPAASVQPESPTRKSVELRLVTVLHQIAVQSEPVDVEQIQSITEQLQRGEYSPDAKDVAEAIMQDLGGR